jgi:benzoyl-CoA reductase/2-hydroxyglutaryl-CoA dehydratase subunit BcrC/BadD/HgdB
MTSCRSGNTEGAQHCAPTCTPQVSCQGSSSNAPSSLTWFTKMADHAYSYAKTEHEKGRPIVGIMCEYTPRELIMAAGAIPVCMCGGSAEMIAPAEEQLPSNLCPLIKSTFGYSMEKTNPFMEMSELIVAETTCDGKKKMYELLKESHRMHVLELPQKPDDPDAFTHWKAELTKLKEALEAQFNVEISDDKIRAAIVQMNRERSLRMELAELMKEASPKITGHELLDMKSLISCIPSDIEQYENALKQLPERDVDNSGRTRVLVTGVPMPHGAEKVITIIEETNGLVVCQENCTGVKPIIENVDETGDPIDAIARKYFHIPCSVMTPNTARIDLLKQLCEDYKPDCIVDVVWQACLTYDVESINVRKLCDEELHIPYMKIETDYFPSDAVRIGNRLQALFETAAQKVR